jgi:triosephosphate isomerase
LRRHLGFLAGLAYESGMKQSVKLIVGNWKMNGLQADLAETLSLAQALEAQPVAGRTVICPPATLIERMARAVSGSAIEIGAQDAHAMPNGAYTGSVSAPMLADAGARLIILGHSERRDGFGETDADVAAKAEAALAAGLEPILCIGESLAEREGGNAVAVVSAQVAGSVCEVLKGRAFALAYEPIWAIGTGLTPTLEQIEEVHLALRRALIARLGQDGATAPILYGGSVKPSNARDILNVPEVGGALVGGASLRSEDFLGILRAA